MNANRLRALPLSFVALFDSFVSFDISHNPLSVREAACVNTICWLSRGQHWFAKQDLPNKFCFEKGPLKEHFGAHFIPKTKTQMVRQLLKEEDEEQLAVERARARRASAVQRVEIAAVTRGRRRSSCCGVPDHHFWLHHRHFWHVVGRHRWDVEGDEATTTAAATVLSRTVKVTSKTKTLKRLLSVPTFSQPRERQSAPN